MRLVEAYSTTSRLRIDKMIVTRHFYPLPFDEPYIVVVTSSGAPAKNYSHYKIVMSRLKPLLKAKGIKVVQVGGPEDERISSDYDACGRTTQYQYFDIIAGAELVLSGDTSAVHIGGHFNTNLVSLFSISAPEVSGSYFGDPEKQIYLTPPAPWTPSYDPKENPKWIDKIVPERIVESVCKLLKIEAPKFETIYIGNEVNIPVIEAIPNVLVRPDFFPNAIFTLRFDKGGEEKNIYEQLRVRKSAIVTNKPLDIDALTQVKPNVAGVVYLVEENDDVAFVEKLHRSGIPYRLVSFLSKEQIQKKKLKYVDFNLIERKDPTSKKTLGLEGADLTKAKFFTNKRVLSDNKSYLSFAHLEQDKVLDNFTQGEDNVIDSQSFWDDADFYYLFK